MPDANASASKPEDVDIFCAICGHPQSDHPMNDVCWRDVLVDGKLKLCSCPGFKAEPQARSASDQAG